MFVEQVRPLLEERFPSEEKLISKVLRFYGIGESRLVTELKDLIETRSIQRSHHMPNQMK